MVQHVNIRNIQVQAYFGGSMEIHLAKLIKFPGRKGNYFSLSHWDWDCRGGTWLNCVRAW